MTDAVQLITGEDLMWHHRRGTRCAFMDCEEEVRYSETTRRVLQNGRIVLSFAKYCIAHGLERMKQIESETSVKHSVPVMLDEETKG